MVMQKHIGHNFFFYIHTKINIQRTHEMNKILNITLIFYYQQTIENYLFYLKKWKRTEMRAQRMNLCVTFYFFFSKTKDMQKQKMNTICEKLINNKREQEKYLNIIYYSYIFNFIFLFIILNIIFY